MTFNCVIVEDEPMARQLLTQYIEKVAALELLAAFANPVKALDFLRDKHPDILFLDVQMPEITGIALLKILKKTPVIILTTAYSEYAIEGYQLDVTDYLLKPITFERFLQAVEKATQKVTTLAALEKPTQPVPVSVPTPASSTTEGYIFVKDGNKLVKVRLNEIMYIEGLKDYVKIHTPKGKITTLQRLKVLEQQLPATQFFRVHHSYIVALEWIDVIQRDEVEISDQMIPVSDTYRKAFKEYVEQLQIGKH
ncbi:MAG: LytTR family DNA-binding domain-containing protein [Bacteroidota bacterium]